MPAILIDPAIRPAIGRWPHIKMSAKYFDQFVRPTTPVSLNCQRPCCRDLQRCGPEAVVAYIETKHERLRSEKTKTQSQTVLGFQGWLDIELQKKAARPDSASAIHLGQGSFPHDLLANTNRGLGSPAARASFLALADQDRCCSQIRVEMWKTKGCKKGCD